LVLTIYRSDCYLFGSRDQVLASWSEWSFHPIGGAERNCESGNRKVRDWPLPFWIKTPPLAKLVDRPTGKHLTFHGEDYGIGAQSAWYLASRGEKGFKIHESTDLVPR
jgi:hypothetical protein